MDLTYGWFWPELLAGGKHMSSEPVCHQRSCLPNQRQRGWELSPEEVVPGLSLLCCVTWSQEKTSLGPPPCPSGLCECKPVCGCAPR